MVLRHLSRLQEQPVIGIPTGARLAFARWSPDSKRVAFCINDGAGFQLWLAGVDDAKANRVPLPSRLHAITGDPFQWLPDSQHFLCLTVPQRRGDPPVASVVPSGLIVQESLGRAVPARTYQDLLKNPHDEALFAYYLQSQMICVDLQGRVQELGEPALISYFETSPDGEYILVESLHPPFSYSVPANRFPKRVEIWNRTGRTIQTLADLPLQDQIPIAFGSAAMGPRAYSWRSDAPASLVWAEALDGGDAGRPAEWRDQVMMWEGPFTAPPRMISRLALRFERVDWGNDRIALVHEWWWQSRKKRAWKIVPADSTASAEVLWDRSWEDRYGDPGVPVLRSNASGHDVLQLFADGRSLFLFGEGASPDGDRPFFDTWELETGQTRRIFRSSGPIYEPPVAVLDVDGAKLLTRRESVDDPPNYFIRDVETDQVRQVTEFPHPNPQLKGLTKELLRYERADGVKITATLYLPPSYQNDQGPLPLLMWACSRVLTPQGR